MRMHYRDKEFCDKAIVSASEITFGTSKQEHQQMEHYTSISGNSIPPSYMHKFSFKTPNKWG